MITRVIAVTMAIALSPVSASADSNYFSYVEPIKTSQVINLGLVRAEADGIVEIYDFHLGQRGKLLGRAMVRRGANPHVIVRTHQEVASPVLAELKINGRIAASTRYPVRRDN